MGKQGLDIKVKLAEKRLANEINKNKKTEETILELKDKLNSEFNKEK